MDHCYGRRPPAHQESSSSLSVLTPSSRKRLLCPGSWTNDGTHTLPSGAGAWLPTPPRFSSPICGRRVRSCAQPGRNAGLASERQSASAKTGSFVSVARSMAAIDEFLELEENPGPLFDGDRAIHCGKELQRCRQDFGSHSKPGCSLPALKKNKNNTSRFVRHYTRKLSMSPTLFSTTFFCACLRLGPLAAASRNRVCRDLRASKTLSGRPDGPRHLQFSPYPSFGAFRAFLPSVAIAGIFSRSFADHQTRSLPLGKTGSIS